LFASQFTCTLLHLVFARLPMRIGVRSVIEAPLVAEQPFGSGFHTLYGSQQKISKLHFVCVVCIRIVPREGIDSVPPKFAISQRYDHHNQ